jgi:histidinol-phosphate aminotransferase
MNYFNKNLYSLTPYTPGEQPKDSRIVKLNTNENPYPPSPQITASIQSILTEGLLRKYPDPTCTKLRELIAQKEALKPENVLITNGSDEALSLLFKAVLSPNSKVVCPYPTYSLYPVLTEIQMNESRIEKIPLKENLHFDIEALSKAKGNLLCFANPNAPTGVLETKEDIISLVKAFSGIVLCDEAYIDFSPKGSSLSSEVDKLANLVVSRTLSKSYSLAGLRVGYLLASEEVISLIYKLKDSYNVGMIEQAIAYTAITDSEYLDQTVRKIIENREFLRKELETLGFQVVPSSSNFLFVKPPENKDAQGLYQSLAQAGIFIRYFSDSVSKDYIRITVGTRDECVALLSELGKN